MKTMMIKIIRRSQRIHSKRLGMNQDSTLPDSPDLGLGHQFKMADIPSNVTYKQLHERFVSDLNGTSVFEIGKVASAAPIGIFLRSILYNILFAKQENLTGSLFCW